MQGQELGPLMTSEMGGGQELEYLSELSHSFPFCISLVIPFDNISNGFSLSFLLLSEDVDCFNILVGIGNINNVIYPFFSAAVFLLCITHDSKWKIYKVCVDLQHDFQPISASLNSRLCLAVSSSCLRFEEQSQGNLFIHL